MHIFWQVGPENIAGMRLLMDQECQREDLAITAQYGQGALRHSLLDMASPPNATQQKQNVRSQGDNGLQSRHNKIRGAVAV